LRTPRVHHRGGGEAAKAEAARSIHVRASSTVPVRHALRMRRKKNSTEVAAPANAAGRRICRTVRVVPGTRCPSPRGRSEKRRGHARHTARQRLCICRHVLHVLHAQAANAANAQRTGGCPVVERYIHARPSPTTRSKGSERIQKVKWLVRTGRQGEGKRSSRAEKPGETANRAFPARERAAKRRQQAAASVRR